jgi:phage baseplate assembly protein W
MGWPHVMQSLQDIFTTRFGARVMREWYGSFVPDMLGSNMNSAELTRFLAAITSSIEQWEPRFRVTRIFFSDPRRDGSILLTIQGAYLPRAMFGDQSVDGGQRTVFVNYNADGSPVAVYGGEV